MMNLSELLNIVTDHVLNVINQEQQEPTIFLTGEVIQVNPLRIKISDKFTLEENSLLLSATVKETFIQVPAPTALDMTEPADNVFQHRHYINAQTEMASDGHGNHQHAIKIYTEFALPKIRLWRGLIVGDVVRLLKVQGGQFYFVLEREEKITNEVPAEEE